MTDDIIADECIHFMTTAFCSICKANHRAAETRKRRARTRNADSWGTEVTLPYPSTVAEYDTCCPSCDEDIEAGTTTIYRADGGWCCRECAEDYHTLGVGVDG